MGRIDQTKDAKGLYECSRYIRNYNGFYQLFLKRIFDILLCVMILPVVLVLMIPIALAIKIEDGGPVFYASRRLGKGFQEFDMLKFRSMSVGAPDLRNDDGSTFNATNDHRVTCVGRFIRETSLDELPQCFNVLLGQMSILGPRAGDVESKDTYEDDEKDKLLVRPGISGYTQAYYRNSISVREKRLYDAWYAHNVSLWLDIRIFFKTIATVLKRENIYTNDQPDGKNTAHDAAQERIGG